MGTDLLVLKILPFSLSLFLRKAKSQALPLFVLGKTRQGREAEGLAQQGLSPVLKNLGPSEDVAEAGTQADCEEIRSAVVGNVSGGSM